MQPLSLLIKPASSLCNLRCKYCFYHSIAEKREIESYGVMRIDLLETLVRKSLDYADQFCTFAFQGGEPTIAGFDFFRNLIEFQKKYNHKKIKIYNTIQTNGTLINEKWAKFLADNKFLVGLSLDGPKDIHDAHRIDAEGKGSFTKVMKTVQLFNNYKVEYNILFVVNNYVARHADKVYNFYKKNGFQYLQFIPCLDPLNEEPGGYEYSLTPERYAYFMKSLFDKWYEDIVNGNKISIRIFDNYIGMILGYPPESCGMAGSCTCYYVIEGDGSVYPCDFYVIDDWYLGNIKEGDFDEMKRSKKASCFVEKSRQVDPRCGQCKWYGLCRGGCRRNREPFKNGEPVLNYFCSAYYDFFEYAGERMLEIAKSISKNLK